MPENALVGIDIGTTNLKLVAVTPAGRTLAVVRRPMRVDRPAPGEAEFHLGALEEALCSGLRALTSGLPPGTRLLALGVDSIGESVVALDAGGEPLGPCATWFDRRVRVSPGYAAVPRERRYDLTGMVEDDIYSVHRIQWFREAVPQVARRVMHWCNVADFAVQRLCGRLVAHPSLAARTGLLDRRTGDWSEELLDAARVSRAMLPQVRRAGQAAGPLWPDVAQATGLPGGLPVVHAGHDHPCALAGCGLSTPGRVLDSTGTAMAVKTLLPGPASYAQTGGRYDCYPHALPGRFVLSGHLPAAGALLDWLAGLTAGGVDGLPGLLAEAAQSPPGANGVRVRPFLGGSGSPWGQRSARAAWLGLSAEHTRGDLCRAALEATAAWLDLNVQAIEAIAGGVASGGATAPRPGGGTAPRPGGNGLEAPEPLVATGGGARSDLWLQVKSALLGRAYTVPQVPEAAAAGAALVAGLAAGVFDTPEEACRLADVPSNPVSVPRGWREAYASLRQELDDLILETLGGPDGTAA